MTATLARFAHDPLALIAELLHLPDGRRFGEAMADFQRRDFEAVFASDARPNTWLSRPRGASKTTDTGAVAIADLILAPDRSRSYACAADADQARLLRDAIERWLLASPALQGSLELQRDLVVNTATGASLRVLAADAPSALGLLPWRVYCDELAAWPSDGLWHSMASALHKVPGARLFVLTTAGSPASWAFRLWEHAHASDMWRVLETPELPPWIDQAQVEDARAYLPAGVFARFYENRWVQGEEALFTTAEVDACIDADREPAQAGDGNHAHTIGVDYAPVHDRTAVAVVKVGQRSGVHELVYLWTAQGSPERRVLVSSVEEMAQALLRRFKPARMLLDPYQMMGTTERLGRDAEEFPFTIPNVVRLSNVLLQVVREKRLRLLPDPDLRAELLSLVVKETSYGWRMQHPPNAHDDRVMALALALQAAEEQVNTPTHDYFVGTIGGDTGWTIVQAR